jgi:hypothetical protein
MLKPYREFVADDITFFMKEVAERGGFASVLTGGSGQATDQGEAVVTYAANPSGKTVLGCLMQDVVDKPLHQMHINFHKDEVPVGSKVQLWVAGTVTTNYIVNGNTPVAGGMAYLGPSGLLQTTAVNAANNPLVGKFLSSKDADGFVKVRFTL